MTYCLIGKIAVWFVLPLAANTGLLFLYTKMLERWAVPLLGSSGREFWWQWTASAFCLYADGFVDEIPKALFGLLVILYAVITVPLAYFEFAIRWVIWRIKRSKTGPAPLAA